METLFSRYEKQYGLPSGLLKAVSTVESSGNPQAVSPKGAQGLFQIMPGTAKELGVDPFNPEAATDGAARYLKQNYDKFGNWDLALAAYNAGPGNVKKYGGIPPFEETQNYVQKVNSKMSGQQVKTSWRDYAREVPDTQQQTAPKANWRSMAKELPDDGTFLQRVQTGVGQRIQKMDESAKAYVAGQQTMPETIIQQGLQGAAVFPGVVGEAISTVTPQWIKDLGGKAVEQVGKLPVPMSDRGDTLAEVLPGELQMVQEKMGPRAVRNVGALGNALMTVPVAQGVASAGNMAVKGATKGATALKNSNIGQMLAQADSRPVFPQRPATSDFNPMAMTASDVKAKAGEFFKQAEELGGTFKPTEVANVVSKEIDRIMPKPVAGSILTREEQLLTDHLKEYSSLRGQSLTLDEIKRLDEGLSRKITKSFVDARTGLPDNDGRLLMQLQNKLREAVDKVPDTPGNDALKNGRLYWKAQIMLDDLDRVVERANTTKNPATSMQTGYRNLFMDKDRIRGWPQEAKDLLEKAATTGMLDDMIMPFASRLGAIGNVALGNLGGTLTAQAIGMAGRGATDKIVAARGAKVQEAILKDMLARTKPVVQPTEDILRGLTPRLPPPSKMSPIDQRAPIDEGSLVRAQVALREQKPTGADMSGTSLRIRPEDGQIPPKLIPPKEQLSRLPLSTKDVTQAQTKLKETKSTGSDTSGSAIKPPVNRLSNLAPTLGKKKTQELNKLGEMLRAGDISQNAFVKDAKKTFGLTEKKARELAKDLLRKEK